MRDKLYDRELECYKDINEAQIRRCGKRDYIDLVPLPFQTMREEICRYFRYRGTQVSFNTILHDKAHYNLFCQAIQGHKNLPESLLDWEERRWVQIVKAYMLQNGKPLTVSGQSVYGTIHINDARQIRFVKNLIHFLQPMDDRPEQEKDIWHLDKLGMKVEQNPIYKTDTLNFAGIKQPGIREEVKRAIYLHLKYENLDTVKREMSSLRQFSKYLQEQYSEVISCKDIDRDLMEDYLIHKATDGSSGKSSGDDIIKLRSVLESVGKLYD